MKILIIAGVIVMMCVMMPACRTNAPAPKAVNPDKNIAATNAKKGNDTVRIANDSLEYEVIIIDAGFNSWLYTRAKPRGFYSEDYLRGRNIQWVTEWNFRVNQPQRYGDMYQMQIDYHADVKYGYEVNYLLFNYLSYFQIANNQRLGGLVPRD
jgi:hypothetical protein